MVAIVFIIKSLGRNNFFLGSFFLMPSQIIILQAPVVQKVDNAIHQINRYPVDKCWQNKPRYPLASDLSGG